MFSLSPRRSLASITALAALGLPLALGTAPTHAAPVPLYAGSATTDLVHLTGVTIPTTLTVADVSLAPASAVANGSGLADPAGATAHSRAANLDVDVLSGTLPLTGLVVEAEQQAPADNAEPATANLLDVPLSPVADAGVATASARARTLAGACTAGTPISEATAQVAAAAVLPDQLGVGSSLLSLHNSAGDTVDSHSTVDLVPVTGSSARGMRSRTTTQVTGITLFGGTANALTINVLAPPTVEAIATGRPGGASVTYTEPVLQVVDATNTVLGTLDASTANTSLDLSPLAVLSLGVLTSNVAADGTSADGSASLLDVQVLTGAAPLTAVDLSVAAASVAVATPVGGVVCPPPADTSNPLSEVFITPSNPVVTPGGTFTYLVGVPNRGTAEVTGTKAVLTIDGPAGFTITGVDLPGATIEGNTITVDLGTLAPNALPTFEVSLAVPSNAATGVSFTGSVTATGTYQGRPVSATATTNEPSIGAVAAPAGCRLAGLNQSSHTEVRPGETWTQVIKVANTGANPCTSVTVTLDVHPGVTVVGCSDGCRVDGRVVTWVIDSLAPGASTTVTATLSAPAGTPADGRLLDSGASLRPGSGSTFDLGRSGPRLTGNSVLARFGPLRPAPGDADDTARGRELARTGGATGATTVGAVVALVVAFGLRSLRRRAFAEA